MRYSVLGAHNMENCARVSVAPSDGNNARACALCAILWPRHDCEREKGHLTGRPDQIHSPVAYRSLFGRRRHLYKARRFVVLSLSVHVV